MGGDYYDRNTTRHLDGSPIFKTAKDAAAEAEVARRLGAAWGCNICNFGTLSPVDWYGERHGRMVGLIELKSRSHDSTRFDTVFLNCRKYLALMLGSIGFGVPAIFVVQFTDRLLWIPVADVDGNSPRIAGCTRLVKAVSDREPVIEVPVANMRPIEDAHNG